MIYSKESIEQMAVGLFWLAYVVGIVAAAARAAL